MRAKVYKVVSFPFGGNTIKINVYKGKESGLYRYLFDLNDLKQLDFDDIDFSNIYNELSELRKLGNFKFVQLLTEFNGGREISFTLNAGQKLEDKNPDVTYKGEPKTNFGFVMQVLKRAIAKVFNEKNNNPSGIVAKWDIGDIVLSETKTGNAEVVEITKVSPNTNKYDVVQYDFDYDTKKYNAIEYEQEIDDFDRFSKDITFEVGDVFSVDLGNGYEDVSVFSIDDFENINLMNENGEILTNDGEKGVKRFLLNSGARVIQSTQKTTKPKYKVGDYILYQVGASGERYVYKVSAIDSQKGNYFITYYDLKNDIESVTSLKFADLENKSELLQIKDGDKFRVRTKKFPPVDVIVKKTTSSNTPDELVLVSAENGTALTSIKSEEEIKDYLFKSLAAEIKNTASGNNQAKYKVGDIVFFGLYNATTAVVKVVEITPTDYKYERHVWNPTVMMLEKKSNEVSIDTFHTLASDISFSVGDKFAVNGGKEYKDVEVTSLAGNLVKIDYKGKSAVYAYGIYDLVVGNLFTSGAIKGTTAKNLNSSNTVKPASATKTPDDYVYSKKRGNIYGLIVDGDRSGVVDLVYFSNGEEEISTDIDVDALKKHYSRLDLTNLGQKFLIPAKLLPPIEVTYEYRSNYYVLVDSYGNLFSRSYTQEELKYLLLTKEAKIVLPEETDEIVDDTTDISTKSVFDEEIEQLNKDIAQLMFFKSLLSPIDFEKKIEISQEITKKQEEVNKLNFYLLEKRLQSDNIFDELFEQSFTPIKNAYSGVYTAGQDETDFFTPDGQKSKLSDALNLMIRTPQFKAWFGDWELAYIYKDTDAVEIDCSKVLTDNFEPMLVWHGTGQEFSYFKFDTFPAAYFAVNSQYSQFFADLHGGEDGFVIPFFLNIRNPLDLTHFKTNDISVKDFFDYIFLQTGMDMDDLEVNPIFMDDTLKPMQTWIYIRNNPNMLKKIAALNVFDGIKFYETNPNIKDKNSQAYQTEAFITFNANQSKIADPERGTILLASMKSFILEKGGAI